jgi:hypothetical protein
VPRLHHAALAVTIVFGIAAEALAVAAISGTWRAAQERGGEMQLNLFGGERGGQSGFNVRIASLTGIDEAQIASKERRQVVFQLDRPAGTIEFLGSFRESRGSGQYIFAPSDAFVRDMQALGYERFSDGTLFLYTIADFSPASIRELLAMGYAPARKDLDDIAIFKITPAYVRALAQAGYTKLPLRKLVEMKIFGVTPEYIESLRQAGYANIPVQKLLQLRMSGADKMILK